MLHSFWSLTPQRSDICKALWKLLLCAKAYLYRMIRGIETQRKHMLHARKTTLTQPELIGLMLPWRKLEMRQIPCIQFILQSSSGEEETLEKSDSFPQKQELPSMPCYTQLQFNCVFPIAWLPNQPDSLLSPCQEMIDFFIN